jgi:hypothetical protein
VFERGRRSTLGILESTDSLNVIKRVAYERRKGWSKFRKTAALVRCPGSKGELFLFKERTAKRVGVESWRTRATDEQNLKIRALDIRPGEEVAGVDKRSRESSGA